jgi:hypothetical protein
VSVDDWDRREMCPDGACIGVIGPEGTCKVCGRAAPNWGDERKRGLVEAAGNEDEAEEDDDEDGDEYDDDGGDDEDGEDDDADYEDEDEAATAADADDGEDPEWSKRRLCSDGACVGVIGSDNKCTVCGKPP